MKWKGNKNNNEIKKRLFLNGLIGVSILVLIVGIIGFSIVTSIYSSLHFCGGVFIANEWVAGVSHCPVIEGDVIRYNTSDARSKRTHQTTRTIKKVINHPSLDLSLFQLSEPVTDVTPMTVALLDPNIFVDIGTPKYVHQAGWGTKSRDGDTTFYINRRRFLRSNKFIMTEKIVRNGKMTRVKTVRSDPTNKLNATALADSGSPLFVKTSGHENVVLGMHSAGWSGGNSAPHDYYNDEFWALNQTLIRPWTIDTLREHSDNGDLPAGMKQLELITFTAAEAFWRDAATQEKTSPTPSVVEGATYANNEGTVSVQMSFASWMKRFTQGPGVYKPLKTVFIVFCVVMSSAILVLVVRAFSAKRRRIKR
ncbi:MAG: hypothetical protein CMD68_00060 [Gammaproteobacteria bacterium]|nr:hypothetical protein [Gammaproteobacteria bacterium]